MQVNRLFARVSLFVIFIASSANASKILGIFLVNSKSHYSVNQRILKTLAARGHEVTVISYFESESKLENYTGIKIESANSVSYIDSFTVDEAKTFAGFWKYYKISFTANDICIEFHNTRFVRELLNSKVTAPDLLIVEMYESKCSNLLAHKLNLPIVTLLPPSSVSGVDFVIGNPRNPAFIPFITSPYTTKMNFPQRCVNTVQHAMAYLGHYFLFDYKLKEICEKYYQEECPDEDLLRERVVLALYNTHFSFLSRPMVPNAIEIGGVHIENAKPLPKRIQNFIDEAENGVIYFSFGSAIRSSSIHAKKLEAIKEVFSSIPQRVLWRSNELNVGNLSQNVMIGKWFPQRDILEHKNVVLFISHGGLLSSQEAIHTETPMIIIPFLYDQYQNGKILEEKEVAIYLEYDKLDKNSLTESITEVVYNKKYMRNMKRLSETFKDRPMSPLDTAVFWIEYVLRHKGAFHMRMQSASMPLHQYFLIDVILFIIVLLFCVVHISRRIFKILHDKLKNRTHRRKKIL